jgi:hypothetical protein
MEDEEAWKVTRTDEGWARIADEDEFIMIAVPPTQLRVFIARLQAVAEENIVRGMEAKA